jgi:hypothetical protein
MRSLHSSWRVRKFEVLHKNCRSVNNDTHSDSIRRAEPRLRDIEEGEPDLNDLIEHWVRVIDRWVQRIDQGMGGTTDGADPARVPDAAPEAALDPPAFEAG